VKAAGVRKITFHHAQYPTLSYLLSSGQVPIAIAAACEIPAANGKS
jgi:hypothetical protein